MKIRIRLSFVLGMIFLASNMSSSAQSVEKEVAELFGFLTGTFIIKERPDDFKINFVWINISFENNNLGGKFLYHKRVLSHAPNKPLVQLLIQIGQHENKPVIRYFALKDSLEQKLPLSKDLNSDLTLISKESVVELVNQNMVMTKYEGVYFGNAQYETTFRDSDFGKIELTISSNEIYNWTRYFKANGELVYGPKEKGYVLKRSEN